MFWPIFWTVWAVGFVLSTYPVFRSIMASVANDNYPPAMPILMGLATAGAALWPVAIPIVVSHAIYTGQYKMSFLDEKNAAKDRVHNDKLVEAQRASNRKQIEAAHREVEKAIEERVTTHRDPFGRVEGDWKSRWEYK